MANTDVINITHVNVRSSVSFLLLKILFVELIAAFLLIIFLGSYYLDVTYLTETRFINVPLFIFMVIIKTFISYYIILQWLNEYYEITPKILYKRRGVFFKSEEKYPLKNMQRVEVKQGFFGRFLNYGTISLYDPRREKYEDMYLIHNPLRYAEIIENLMPDADFKKDTIREHVVEKDIFDPK